MLGPTGHVDNFARDGLPPARQWPELPSGGYSYPEFVNVGFELTDAMVAKGFGDNTALIGSERNWTYSELADWTNQLANILVDDMGIRPGNRILIRSGNNPAMIACWLAATKAGAVPVNSMPMLREAELSTIVDKAEIAYALCDMKLIEELSSCAQGGRFLKRIMCFDGASNVESELDRLARAKPKHFNCCKTSGTDVALILFTSGTTGIPKATMHFHRDLLIFSDGFPKQTLDIQPSDVIIGSMPLAFSMGLGFLALCPLRFGAAAVILENASPLNLTKLIENYKVTVCISSPTAYQIMVSNKKDWPDLSSLRVAISGGEPLPGPTYDHWLDKTGIALLNCFGTTEMMHVFISNSMEDRKRDSLGRAQHGYDVKIIADDMTELPRGEAGHLVVQGPTGCRYLHDDRQGQCVRDGWNLTGDTCTMDDAGFVQFVSRTDDMIVSAGYNIAGPEVENALLSHEAVDECAVIGVPDRKRNMLVEAHIVLNPEYEGSDSLRLLLQKHAKATIAPYKYPRSIKFVDALPKSIVGKLHRSVLRAKVLAEFDTAMAD
jgi:2-aminobenzoate-CoA ligase